MGTVQLRDAPCPVSADALGQLYRADPVSAAGMLDGLPEDRKVELALFCYSRAHLRPLAMSIAAKCDAARLAREAGTLGEVLAAQCQQQVPMARAKISLAGTRH